MAKTDTTETPAAPKIAPAQQVNLRQWQYGGSCPRRMWDLKANPGDTAEAPLSRDWWKQIGQRVSRHDVVHVFADDESWELELRVEASGPGFAEVTAVKLIKRQGVSQAQEILGDGTHVLTFVGGNGFCVKRIADGCLVVQGEHSASAARIRWLAGQPKAA